MKKKLKYIAFYFFASILLFVGDKTNAAGVYSEEGIAFYAQVGSSGYAIEGVAFYSYQTQVVDTFPVYRFVSNTNGDHFYTASEDEKNTLTGNANSGFIYEGIAFYAKTTQVADTLPVYRFVSTFNGLHFYTANEDEKNALTSNPQWGYKLEGVAFYANSSQVLDTFPVYRFLSPSNGAHFYTASEDEKNYIAISPVYRFFAPTTGDHFYTAFESEKSIISNTFKSGYYPEGIAFFNPISQIASTFPVYRFSNSKNGDHFYTTTEDEKTYLINNPQSGYSYEGIAFYAPTTKLPGYYPVYRFVNSVTGDHFYTTSESERYALVVGPLGPEISVGLWSYSKADIMNSGFQIDANKAYNVKDSNGNILAQVASTTTTKVSYNDSQNQLTVEGPITKVMAGTNVTFDAADGDNSSLVLNTHRSTYVATDWRGKIDRYRGKIKVQYYRGYDIANGATVGSPDVTQIWINNIIPLEQYVWGTAETSGTKNINHTQAMVTAVRTYGFWYIKYANKYAALGFKIRSDSGSQNYGGYDWELSHPNIPLAAKNTRAVIATYAGDVALTPYSSASDGRTRSWQEKWGGTSYPWCQSVPDPYGKDLTRSGGSHMVGMIGFGSENLAGTYGWDWQRILKYYYTGIGLTTNY